MAKNKKKPKFKGRQKLIKKRSSIDMSKQNAGGFYEGMPGVTLDEHGNRKFIEFVVTPEGKATSVMYADPQLIKLAVKNSFDNVMIRQAMYGAVVDHLFQNKTFWNWILRMAYKRWFKRKEYKLMQMRMNRPQILKPDANLNIVK